MNRAVYSLIDYIRSRGSIADKAALAKSVQEEQPNCKVPR